LLIYSYAVRHTHFHDVTHGTHIFGYALARRLSKDWHHPHQTGLKL